MLTKLANKLERLSYFYIAIADDLCHSRGFWHRFYTRASGALYRAANVFHGPDRYDDAYGSDTFSRCLKTLHIWRPSIWDKPLSGRSTYLNISWGLNEDSMLTA